MFSPKDVQRFGMMTAQVLTGHSLFVVRGIVASCCRKRCRSGESVLLRGVVAGNGEMQTVVLHRRCLLEIVENMALDEDQQSFLSLREAIIASGNFFEPRSVDG